MLRTPKILSILEWSFQILLICEQQNVVTYISPNISLHILSLCFSVNLFLNGWLYYSYF